MKRAKRLLSVALMITTCIWSLGLPLGILIPTRQARAVSGGLTVDSALKLTSPGINLPKASPPVPVLGLNLAGTMVSIDYITITVEDYQSSGFDPSTDLAPLTNDMNSGLQIYKENTSNGVYGTFENGVDFVPNTYTPIDWVGSGPWTSTISFSGPGGIIPDSDTGDYTGIDYDIAVRTNANAANGKKFKVSIQAGGLAVNGNPGPSIAAATTDPMIIDTQPLMMNDVVFISPQSLDIIFNKDLDQTSSQTAGNYTLWTDDNFDNSSVTNVMLQPDNRTVRLFADNANINDMSGSDYIIVDAAVKDISGAANQSTSPWNIMSNFSPLVISEVQVSGGTDDDEFVELFNRSGSDVNVQNMGLILHTVAAMTDTVLPLSFINTTVPPNGFFLITSANYDGAVSADATYSGDNLKANGAVYISTSTQANMGVIDKLGWGSSSEFEGEAFASTPAANGSLERKSYPGATAESMASGGTDETNGHQYDSDYNKFDFVAQSTSNPQNILSPTEMPGGFENGKPFIMHMPLWKAASGSDLKIMAKMGDDSGSLQSANTKLYYCAGGSTEACNTLGEYTGANGTAIGSDWFKFTVPSAALNTNNDLRYILLAIDPSDTSIWQYMSADPNADMMNNGQDAPAHPFMVDVVSPPLGSSSITGTVTGSGPISGVTVFLEGTGFSTTTDIDGNFTLSGLPGGTFNLIAAKTGYMDSYFNSVPAGTTSLSIGLWEGNGGQGGDINKPFIMWTGPPDGMTGVPSGMADFKLFFQFSEEMDAATVNDTNAGDADSNIFLTLDGTTKIPGNVGYFKTQSDQPQEAQGMYPPDDNLGVFSPSSGLLANKTYFLVFTPGVRDKAGNPLDGNKPGGGHMTSFSTMANFSSQEDWTDFGSGAMNPPFMMGSNPSMGAMNIPTNAKITINMSQPMDSSSVSASNIKMMSKSFSGGTAVAVSFSSVSLDTAGTTITLTPTALEANKDYEVQLTGALKSSSGIWMGDPGQGQNTNTSIVDSFHFMTGSAGDTTAPTVMGTWPNNGDTNVPTNLGAIDIGLSEQPDPATVNTNTVTLKAGTVSINGTIEVGSIRFIPSVALSPSTTYTLTIKGGSSGVKDLAGNALSTDYTASFTTVSTSDGEQPFINFANADDFSIAITFSEPMISAKIADTLNWSGSVLNPSNYSIKQSMPQTTDWGPIGTEDLSSAVFKYEGSNNTVVLEGLSMAPMNDFFVTVTGVKDLSGNAISTTPPDNTFRGPVQSSMDTGGMLGPGMMKGGFDMGQMGMMPIGVWPNSQMAGMTTLYFIDIPTSKVIDDGGKVVITFPTGFDVSGAKRDPYSPMNGDMNGPGPCTVTFGTTAETSGGGNNDGIVVNTSARTVTIELDITNDGFCPGLALPQNDFVHIDVTGIKNSTVPKGPETSGYTADIKTKKSDGTLQESLVSMPFFITSAGSNQIDVTVTATGIQDSTQMMLMAGSPQTGPMDQMISFSSGTATHSYTNLPDGEYFIFTEPFITDGTKEFMGKQNPEPIRVSGGETKGKNITLLDPSSQSGSRSALTVNVSGPANEPLDVFANKWDDFIVKQVTLDGSGQGSYTLYLSDGDWNIGVGPQMPKGPQTGPPPMPDYMPPEPVNLNAEKGRTPEVYENSGTANDGTINFTLQSTNRTISGTVKDGSGNAISNAEVYAYSPNGGMGSNTQSLTDGTFTLKVADGSYVVGAFKMGMPNSPEKPVSVSGSNVSGLKLVISKSGYTISGKVTDGTNSIPGASVYAYRTDGPGNADTMTDNSGNYILYVNNGTWKIGVFLPGYGNLPEKTIAVNGASIEGQNFSPTSGGTTFYTISGRVYKDTVANNDSYDSGEELANVEVWAHGPNGGNSGKTLADGTYSFKVPAGTYTIEAWSPDFGDMPPINNVSIAANVTGKDFRVEGARTVSIYVTSNINDKTALIDPPFSNVFIDFYDQTNNFGNFKELKNTSTSTIKLPDGQYDVHVHIPGMEFTLNASTIKGDTGTDFTYGSAKVTVDGNEGIIITPPAAYTVSGKVYVDNNPANGSYDAGEELSNAWVEIGNPDSGIHFGAQSDSTGSYSVNVPNGSYMIGAHMAGYLEANPSTVVVNGGNETKNIPLSQSSKQIYGRVTLDGSGVDNGFVRAERQGGGFSGAPTDANGYYYLDIDVGTWKLFGMTEGYMETAYASNPLEITSGSPSVTSGINIAINPANTITMNPPKNKPMTPASGGTFQDTDMGLKITVPANALGTSQSAGTINAKETTNVPSTLSATPVGGKGKEITATDNSGQPINTLNDSVTLEFTYSKTELNDAGITFAQIPNLKIAYWDDTADNWVSIPTTVIKHPSTATDMDGLDSSPAVTLKGTVNHFTVFAPIAPKDSLAPSAPTSVTATGASGKVSLSWTAPTTNADASALADLLGYEVYRSTSASGTYTQINGTDVLTNSYDDTTAVVGTTYYYKITAADTGGNESVKSSASNGAAATSAGGGGGGGSSMIYPSNTSIRIANNADATTSRNVTLNLFASNASYVLLSESANFSGASWQSYQLEIPFTLSEGNGTKRVYAKFKSSTGHESYAIWDEITLNEPAEETAEEEPAEEEAVTEETPTAEEAVPTLYEETEQPVIIAPISNQYRHRVQAENGQFAADVLDGTVGQGKAVITGILPKKFLARADETMSDGFVGEAYQLVVRDLATMKNSMPDTVDEEMELTMAYSKGYMRDNKIDLRRVILTRYEPKTQTWVAVPASLNATEATLKAMTKKPGVYIVQIAKNVNKWSKDGAMNLDIPPGTTSPGRYLETAILPDQFVAAPSRGYEGLLSKAYNLITTGAEGDKNRGTLAHDVDMTVRYDKEAAGDESLVLARYNPVSRVWNKMQAVWNNEVGTFRALVNQLGVYAIMMLK